VISEPAIIELRNDEEALVNARLGVSSLEHDKFGDLVVTLHDGIRVLFGDGSDLAQKIPLVEPILTQVGRAGRPIAAIDLRAPKTPVVEYKK
jgi:cell division septal protein FtsQ